MNFRHFGAFACLCVFMAMASLPLYGQECRTTIRVDTAGEAVRLIISSTGKLTCRTEHLSQTLAVYISPVEKDSQIPKEFPINSGLVKKIRFIHQKEKELLIAIDVVSLPQYYIRETDDKKGITLTIEREMFGSPVRTIKKKDGAETRELETPESPRMRKMALFFNSALSSSMIAAQPPLEIVPEDRIKSSLSLMFDATKKDSLKSRLPSLEDQGNAQLRKKYSLLIDATRNTAPPVSGFKNSTAVNSGSKKNFISQEFTSTQLVVILKFLADRLGLNLITSPHMDESKSVVLSEMTAEEAIPLVLKGTDYCYRISGNLLLVGPSDIIETLSPDITADLSAEEIVRIFVLRKVRVEKIRAELEDTFPKAKVEARKGLNAFIITAEKSTMDKIEQFLKKKDR